MRISENWIYLEQNEIPAGITLQGMADFLAPHFGGDCAMHHFMIREVADQIVLFYSPGTSEREGLTGPFCCLNGWGGGEDLFFEDDELLVAGEASSESKRPTDPKKTPGSMLKILNLLREERGLPKAKRSRTSKKPKITREVIREICIQVWKEKYPRALTDADFVLGELTTKLVEQEVERRIAILMGELIPLKR